MDKIENPRWMMEGTSHVLLGTRAKIVMNEDKGRYELRLGSTAAMSGLDPFKLRKVADWMVARERAEDDQTREAVDLKHNYLGPRAHAIAIAYSELIL